VRICETPDQSCKLGCA